MVARSFIRQWQQQHNSVKLLSWCGIHLGYLVPLPWCTKVVYGVRYAVSVLVSTKVAYGVKYAVSVLVSKYGKTVASLDVPIISRTQTKNPSPPSPFDEKSEQESRFTSHFIIFQIPSLHHPDQPLQTSKTERTLDIPVPEYFSCWDQQPPFPPVLCTHRRRNGHPRDRKQGSTHSLTCTGVCLPTGVLLVGSAVGSKGIAAEVFLRLQICCCHRGRIAPLQRRKSP